MAGSSSSEQPARIRAPTSAALVWRAAELQHIGTEASAAVAEAIDPAADPHRRAWHHPAATIIEIEASPWSRGRRPSPT